MDHGNFSGLQIYCIGPCQFPVCFYLFVFNTQICHLGILYCSAQWQCHVDSFFCEAVEHGNFYVLHNGNFHIFYIMAILLQKKDANSMFTCPCFIVILCFMNYAYLFSSPFWMETFILLVIITVFC